MKTPTRQRLVEAATRRFYRDGFRSVGIDQILSDVGISKTAFYKHFESKEDLMLGALELGAGSRFVEWTAARASAGVLSAGRVESDAARLRLDLRSELGGVGLKGRFQPSA